MKKIEVNFTDVEERLLKQLNETGLWGFTISETIERLVAESLREKISAKQLVLRLRGGSTQKRGRRR